jgi:hypothetical protein
MDWQSILRMSGEEDDNLRDLEALWWVLDREPGMDDLAEDKEEVLKVMQDDLEIYPFQDQDENDRLFLARFEIPKYGESFQYSEALLAGEPCAWIDFLAGFPVDCVEMLLAIGEYSSQAKEGEDSKVAVKDGTDKPAAPVPEKFFEWPEDDKILLNLTGIATKNVAKILAENISGEPKPEKAHWWFRVNLVDHDEKKWPVPGEFLGLGVRLMPDRPWGKQLSSPFIWSGNWFQTVYLTSAVIKEIIEPTDEIPYPTYNIKWQGQEINNVRPSDFASYEINDRVSILKNIETEKLRQLWKDDDQNEWGDNWQIIPTSYYGGI